MAPPICPLSNNGTRVAINRTEPTSTVISNVALPSFKTVSSVNPFITVSSGLPRSVCGLGIPAWANKNSDSVLIKVISASLLIATTPSFTELSNALRSCNNVAISSGSNPNKVAFTWRAKKTAPPIPTNKPNKLARKISRTDSTVKSWIILGDTPATI